MKAAMSALVTPVDEHEVNIARKSAAAERERRVRMVEGGNFDESATALCVGSKGFDSIVNRMFIEKTSFYAG